MREYTIEISHEVFKKLYWVTKGKNLARQDDPDKLTVSGLAETVLRQWLTENHLALHTYWEASQRAEDDAIDHVKEQNQP